MTSPLDDLPERPKMAVVETADPVAGRDHVVVFCPARDRYIRIQGPQWAFLRSLDGRRTIPELERDFSARLPDGIVRPLLARFAEVGLLEGSVEDEQRESRRLRITRLGAIQFSVADPDRWLDRLTPLIRMVGGRSGRMLSALVVAVGGYSTAVHADLAAPSLGRVADPAWAATLVVALLLCVVVHELGHAGAVKYFGGRVRRMGLMLFYLAPALFCDTSDAWRFPHKRQRAIVAAAGIWVQMVIAGFAGMTLWLPLGADGAAWLWSFALFNLVLCVVNLIPFVQLDGYWVLVALTDVPNLRSRALAYLRATVVRVVAGVAQPQTPPLRHSALTLMFGLGCMVFPPVLVLIMLLNYQHALLRLGRPGAAAWLLLAGSVAAVPRRGLLRIIRSACGWPSRARWRAGLLGGAVGLAVAGVFAIVRVPLTVQGRFEASAAGEVVALLPAPAHAYLDAGDHVGLRGLSVVDRTGVAQGVLAHELQRGDHELRYRVVLDRSAMVRVPRPGAGLLSVRAGKVVLPVWLWSVYLQPTVSTLRGT